MAIRRLIRPMLDRSRHRRSIASPIRCDQSSTCWMACPRSLLGTAPHSRALVTCLREVS
ncbi:hypothetical protein EJ03DRAFT_327452 [Teratosphaeria nubilosa]|uniref:Uncharacterized protein n=1 Tax=Teratosphaeria nubilosa TaxID=161662 RepID=A0A6G1L8Y1_9PEZI|nr:hypothetical protein EJ03DRAFT_327452 [Teratosphaeria nubilosa]